MGDLDAVEDRIWALLDRYRDELEEATIYGMPSLRWPGSGAHDYFAAVKRSAQKVSLYAVAVDTWPQALEGSSEEFKKRRTGKATFSFTSLDDEMAAELEALLARLYKSYRAHHASADELACAMGTARGQGLRGGACRLRSRQARLRSRPGRTGPPARTRHVPY